MISIGKYINVPDKLKEEGLFCCWNLEERGGSRTKVPYIPEKGAYAKANDPHTFTGFECAVKDAADNAYDGIGVGIFGSLCAIDIDDCVTEDGRLSQLADYIVRIMNSYTEFSPSGRGIHILFKADNFEYDKDSYYIMNRNLGLEVYVAGATNKYVTVTGNVIGNFEFGDRTEQLKAVLEKYMRRAAPAVNGVNAANGRNGTKDVSKYKRLYDGDWSNYESQSEADLALCIRLAIFTGKNMDKMDELFRKSGLMRDKWDRVQAGSTYGEITMEKAIEFSDSITGGEFMPLRQIINPKGELPPFPVESLPPVVRDYVVEVAAQSQTSPDMSGALSLGVLAICLQGKYRIEGSPGYYEPLSLYTVVIADPGERKSGVVDAMAKILSEFEDEYNEEHAKELRENRTRRKKLSGKIAGLEEKLADDENGEIESEILRLQEELEKLPVMKPLRLIADDATVEALTSLLANNDGRLGVVSSEGGTFEGIQGKGNNYQNIDVWLKGHCGDPIMIDRLGRSEEKIKHPHLSAVLAIQPFTLNDIMRDEKLGGRGLLARFLYCSPPTYMGRRKFYVPGVPAEVKKNYKELLGRLIAVPVKEEPETLTLSEDAVARMEIFFAENERFLVSEGQEIVEWASKYIGAVLRIAGIIHLAGEKSTNVVSAETIDDAIAIGRFFLEQAKYAYSNVAFDKTIRKTGHILSRIRARGEKEIKLWQIQKDCRSSLFKNAEDVRKTLMLLEESGYIKIVTPGDRKGPGRKAAEIVKVNPVVFDLES